MNAVVYVDMLFLVNFVINMILLKITDIFTRHRSHWLRMCLSSVLGAVYAMCMFFPQIKMLYIFPMKMAFSVLMILIVNPKSSFAKTVKMCAVFYLVSFTFAGILLALIYFTNFAASSAPKISNGIFYFDISLTTLLICSALAYILIRIASAIFSSNKIMGIKHMKIMLGGRECNVSALADTGNLLTDPLSNLPVIIAEKNRLEMLFPHGLPDAQNGVSNGAKMRLIPYSSLGNESGMMTGFVADEITVDGKKICNAIIGISEGVLSKDNEYQALFNPNILN